MKKGIVYGSLPPHLDVEERFRLAAQAGFDGIEVHGTDSADELKRAKAAADAAGLQIPSIMASTHWAHPLSSADAATRQRTVDSMIFTMENAHLVSADTVLLVPGVVDEATSYEDAYARSQAEIKNLAPVAEKHNVTIAIENVWNKLLLSPLEFKRYIEEIGSPNVKAYFDCGNILTYGYPHHWIRTLGPLLHRVHVKDFRLSDHTFVYLLHGDVPWAAVMAALREVGYDNYIAAELPPYPQCPDQMVFDTSHALSRIFDL
ncbi:MAG TPA: sugar phosphate isomerase/epimerase family protein [Abditibacteriaceae bacterium]|nr:sugar phosphate isomerase/epimerase family protein [Abditibacteriaceae bacterium]